MACIDNQGGNSKWEKALLIFNGSNRAGKAELPAGNWQILADGENAFHWRDEETVVSERVPVAEYSAMILGLK